MCGRYSLTSSIEKLSKRFNIKVTEEFRPRYNAAPTQFLPVITNRNPSETSFMKWGLIPNWALDDSTSTNLINARAETILTKAPFKQIIKSHRCLIPADGFYEWKKEGKNKVPHRITLASDELFAFAGLWDSWEDKKGDIVNSFTIITTSANSLMSEIHERMPVILPKDLELEWIKMDLTDNDITELLKPYPSEKMSYYKAHRAVNSPMYDIPDCIQIAPKIYPGETFNLFD
jgi:putative SOS response-associated peptidase YedK